MGSQCSVPKWPLMRPTSCSILLLGTVDFHAFGGGHGDQQKLDAAQEIRSALFEQALKGFELLAPAFGIVHTAHRHNQRLGVHVLADALGARLAFGRIDRLAINVGAVPMGQVSMTMLRPSTSSCTVTRGSDRRRHAGGWAG